MVRANACPAHCTQMVSEYAATRGGGRACFRSFSHVMVKARLQIVTIAALE